MIFFKKEGDDVNQGFNYYSMSSGGFVIKFRILNLIFYFRKRKEIKPVFIFDWFKI